MNHIYSNFDDEEDFPDFTRSESSETSKEQQAPSPSEKEEGNSDEEKVK